MPKKPIIEFLPFNIEAMQNNAFLIQGLPFLISFGFLVIAYILDDVFHFRYQNPDYFVLILGITFIISSFGFLIVIIQKEYFNSIIIRGKLAVIIGIAGFSFLFFFGSYMLYRYVVFNN